MFGATASWLASVMLEQLPVLTYAFLSYCSLCCLVRPAGRPWQLWVHGGFDPFHGAGARLRRRGGRIPSPCTSRSPGCGPSGGMRDGVVSRDACIGL